MRRRLRYFRLFGLMTVVFVLVMAIYLGARKRAESPPIPTNEPVLRTKGVTVVLAATDLMPRTLLTPELLEEREARSAPEGVFLSKDEAVYRLTLTFIRKGEPIFRQHVTPPLKETSAAYLIPPGQVGMALTVTRPETVPPLRAGDYISIHAVFAGMKVRTIVPRAMVLAVNNRVGDIPITSSTQASSTTQQTSQQPQPSSPEKEQVTLFVALSPQEAKAIALAVDSGATFYYTLHSAPLPPLLPPGLERDLTLQELTGSPQVAALIVKKQHGELPQISQAARTEVNSQTRQPPLAPVTLSPAIVSQLDRLDRSVRSLQQQVQRLEQSTTQTVRLQEDSSARRRVIGVMGDQTVTFIVPPQKTKEGGWR